MNIERTAEDKGEAEHIVDLIGIVTAPSAKDNVWPRCLGLFVGDLRVGIGHREDDGVFAHTAHHLARHTVGCRKPNKDICPNQRLFHCAQIGLDGPGQLELVHALPAPFVDHAARVAHDDIFLFSAQRHVKLSTGDARCAGTIDDDNDLVNPLLYHFQRIDQPRARDDRGAMLVIVKDGNIDRALQFALDEKTFRCFNIL